MRILFLTRLMSGWERSFRENIWKPSGAPTLYKLIEGLVAAKDVDADIVLTHAPKDIKPATYRLQGLDSFVRVLSGFNYVPARLRYYITQYMYLFFSVLHCIRKNPDVIYVDRANILVGAIVARYLEKKVVLRIMGITPEMHELLTGNRLFHKLLRWCYRSPFAWVLCTQEGSGVEQWVQQALDPSVPRDIWINGVDVPKGKQPRPQCYADDKVNVLFLGRLNYLKQCQTFVDALCALPKEVYSALHVSIVGEGEERKHMEKKLDEAGILEHISFVSSVPHDDVYGYYTHADIYVSLNKQGNLSNTNLEAFSSGVCTILLAADQERGIDVKTETLFPKECVQYIDRTGTAQALTNALETLVNARESREDYAKNVQKQAKSHLSSWKKRINHELDRLKSL